MVEVDGATEKSGDAVGGVGLSFGRIRKPPIGV
jgi:hypothetical protein